MSYIQLTLTTLTLSQPVLLNQILRSAEEAAKDQDVPSVNYLVMHPGLALQIVASDLGFSSLTAYSAGSEGRRNAYLWAGSAFRAMLLKSEIDLQNFYRGRRATLRQGSSYSTSCEHIH